MNLIHHTVRQMHFSATAFGPGSRQNGVCDHIRKELIEIGSKPTDLEQAVIDAQRFIKMPERVEAIIRDRAMRRGQVEEHNDPKEWVDVWLLAMDGLWRSLREKFTELTDAEIAELITEMIDAKQTKNEARNWPDWRGASPDKAIEHVKGHND